jgi:hypothetical protein
MEEHQQEYGRFETEETFVPPMHTLPSKYAQDFMRVYGSIVTTSANIFEVSFVFGQPITEDPHNAYIERKVSVTMSWQAAKAFAQLLNATILSYEKQAGEIKIFGLFPPSDPPDSA